MVGTAGEQPCHLTLSGGILESIRLDDITVEIGDDIGFCRT